MSQVLAKEAEKAQLQCQHCLHGDNRRSDTPPVPGKYLLKLYKKHLKHFLES